MLPTQGRRLATTARRALWGFSSKPATPSPSLLPKHQTSPSSALPTLTELFDSPAFLHSSTLTSTLSPSTGLFSQPHLVSPSTLRALSDSCILHSQLLLRRLHLAPSRGQRELKLVVKNFDRLSDKLCSVIDLCEVLVTCHPDKKWRREAEGVHADLCRLMMGMNVDQGLYESLKAALDDPAVHSSLSEEELRNAHVFIHDFSKSGITLPSASARQSFVDLSDQILHLSRQFASSLTSPPTGSIRFPDASVLLPGLGESFVRRVKSRNGSATIGIGSWEAGMVLRKCANEEARRKVWVACNGGEGAQGEEKKIAVLEAMLNTRAKVAGLVGRGSWGEVELENKMAQKPEYVLKFLQSLASSNKTSSLSELSLLSSLKHPSPSSSSSSSSSSISQHVQPWDRDYLLQLHHTTSSQPSSSSSSSSSLTPLSPYFSLGTVLSGLSTLFKALYGITLTPTSTLPGETWHPSVRKLQVISQRTSSSPCETIGYVYCDLFHRPGKSGNAAHYTVRCSRRVDDDDFEGDLEGLEPSQREGLSPDGLRNAALEVKGVKGGDREGEFQLPISVLNCDFEEPTVREGATLLSFQEVETIFHEMGHAMHSMIGRTAYGNVSGTRTATDLAEFPSIFMESFVNSPTLLPLLVAHHSTGQPPTPELIAAHLKASSSFPSIEIASQVQMALVDQKLHAISPSDPLDSSQIYHDVTESMGLYPSTPGTSPQTQFGHLNGYGASYYAYLFDRAIAGRVWSEVFKGGKGGGGLEGLREGGERLSEEVLKWGGAKDPWEMVGGLLKDDVIRGGGGAAMEKVGEWGIKGWGSDGKS